MTLFAFTYANACTAMKGFDKNKNKKLEEEERSRLVYYIEVSAFGIKFRVTTAYLYSILYGPYSITSG